MRARLLLALLIAVGFAPFARGDEATQSFNARWYRVRLIPDFASQTVVGEESIRIQSRVDGLHEISFSANAYDIEASLDDEKVPSEIVGGRRVFHLPKPLAAGQSAILELKFSGKPEKGIVFGDRFVRTNYFTCDVIV